MDNNKAKATLRKLRLIIKISPLDDKIIGLALNDDTFSDFEAALQYFTALENGNDMIITRNLKNFKSTVIPAFTAKHFIESINK